MVGFPSRSRVDERSVSRFQFARPAVVESFLLQIIFTPPVEAERLEISPLVIVESSSWRKDSASSCLRCVKAFLASFARRSCFVGLFFGDSESEVFLVNRGFGGCFGVFRGENSSFQSFITSWDQKLSILGRWGVKGIRWIFLGEARPFGLGSGLPGGVVK